MNNEKRNIEQELNNDIYKRFKINNNSCSDNSISISNSKNNEVKLNLLIYNEIEFYLIYNQPFERLLEFSLICKSSFKSIQHYLTFKQKQIQFYLKINQFLNYINSINNYSYKLIQFKQIKKINFKSIQDENYYKLKSKLQDICGVQLEKVIFRDYYLVNSYDLNPTLNNFYQFNKLSLYWDRSQPPYSPDERNEFNMARHIYTFDFLRYYKTKKIKISSARKDMDLHLSNLDNLLHKSSHKLESIKFDFTVTPFKFVLLSLQLKSLKSLSIRLGNFSFCLNEYNIYKNGFSFDEEDDEEEEYAYETQQQEYNCNGGNINKHYCNTSKLVYELFKKSNISNNNSLEKLKLKKCVDYIISPNNKDPSLFLTQLIGNNNIKKLGLELFDLKESNSFQLLSPLYQLKNISTLYCNYESIEQFLLHCNENPNIKTLCLVDDVNNTCTEYNPNLFNIISTFIKQNKSSLQYLIIKNIFYDNDLNNLIINHNNQNNNLKIIYKTK